MLKTGIYLVGTLALHFTDFSHPNGFYSTFLPLVDMLFLIFLIIELQFFFGLVSFAGNDEYRFYDLLIDIYDLRYDIQDKGLFNALLELALNLIETVCIFFSIYYFGAIAIGLIRL